MGEAIDRELLEAAAGFKDVRACATCADYDDECDEVRDKTVCWLYDPGRGMCPYLRAAASIGRNGGDGEVGNG